jgi:hypothetical protein
MTMYRGLYYATIAGMLGGLVAALVSLLIGIPLADSSHHWIPDATHFVVFGISTAIILFLYFDRMLLGKMRPSSILWGLLFGGLAGVIASFLEVGLRSALTGTSPVLYRIAAWTLCLSVIGIGIGMRWVKTNPARTFHSYAGSLVGGLLGGLIFALFAPHIPAGLSLAGLMIAGAGTGFGTGIAPILVRDGLMRFISSGDARAQNKLGQANTAWDLEIDESYVLGSVSTTSGGTRFQQGADICIPDASIAPRHAVVFSREGRYYIARHPDAAGSEGIAKYVLRIKGKTVVSSQELHPSDDLLIGRTALRFESRKQGE